MRHILLNSSMMPTPGVYRLKKISKEDFFNTLNNWGENYESYIGYDAVIDILKQIGIQVKFNRNAVCLDSECDILIIKLKYRLLNPAEKKAGIHGKNINDYEFYSCHYIQ